MILPVVIFNVIFLVGVSAAMYHFSRKRIVRSCEEQDLQAICLAKKIVANNNSSDDIDVKVDRNDEYMAALERVVLAYESRIGVKSLENVTLISDFVQRKEEGQLKVS